MPNMEDHAIFGAIPDVYDPPLSQEVIDCAQRIATDFLNGASNLYYRDDTPLLYRLVRTAMGRRYLTRTDNPTLDDESISEGIIRALNEHKRAA
jgi:hypothetical protein